MSLWTLTCLVCAAVGMICLVAALAGSHWD